MDLKLLEDFVALAEHGNFSRAARVRHVTQPAFSRRIRALENWLGVVLVERDHHPTTLTSAGREFVADARNLISAVYASRERLRADQDRQRSLLFFAQHSLAVSFFPVWLRSIRGDMGNDLIRLQADNLHDALEAFLSGAGDFLLCFATADGGKLLQRGDVEAIEVGSDRLLPVCAAGADGQQRHYPNDKGEVRLLNYPADSFFGTLVRDRCIPRISPELSVSPVFENALVEAIKSLAVQDLGLAWLPESTIKDELGRGQLQALDDVLPSIDLKILLYRSTTIRSDAATAFWQAAMAAGRGSA